MAKITRSLAATTALVIASAGLIAIAPTASAMSESVLSSSVGRGPEAILAIAGSTRILVANTSANTISVLDSRNMSPVDTLVGFGEPRAIAQAPSQAGVVAVILDSSPAALRMLDVTSGLVTETIPIPGAILPTDLAVYGSRWYVADPSAHEIHVYDSDTGAFAAPFPVSGNPTRIALSPDGRTLYVVAGAFLYAVDASSGALLGSASSSGFYTGVRAIGGAVYASVDVGLVEKYTAVSLVSKATFPDAGILRAIAPAFGGAFAYVANETASTIDLMRLADGVVLGRASQPASPNALSVSPSDFNIAYAVSTAGDSASQAYFIPSSPSRPTITSVSCQLKRGVVTVRARWSPLADPGDLGITGFRMMSHRVGDSHWSPVRSVGAAATTASNRLTAVRVGQRIQVLLMAMRSGGVGSSTNAYCRVR